MPRRNLKQPVGGSFSAELSSGHRESPGADSDAPRSGLGYGLAESLRYTIAPPGCVPLRTAPSPAVHSTAHSSTDAGGSMHLATRKPSGAARGVFRISVRVTGPRNTEAYIQTTAG